MLKKCDYSLNVNLDDTQQGYTEWKMTVLILVAGFSFALWMNIIFFFAKWMFFTLVNAEFLASCFKLTPTLSRIRRRQAVILYQERTAIYPALTWEKKHWKSWQCLNSSANIDIHLLNNYCILKGNLGTSHTLYILSAPEFSGFS